MRKMALSTQMMVINHFIAVCYWSPQESILYHIRAAAAKKCVLIGKVVQELFPSVYTVCHGTLTG